MDINEAKEKAMSVQDACNLSAVVHTFEQVIQECLWTEAKKLGMGTDWINKHSVCVMFASKIASLTGCEDGKTFGKAFQDCSKKG
jgi:hypothetical protein